MSSGSWPREIPEQLCEAYKNTLELLTERLPHVKGLYLSQRFYRFLDLGLERVMELPVVPTVQQEIDAEKSRMLAKRDRLDPLLVLFREWAEAERSPQTVHEMEMDGAVFSYPEPVWTARTRLEENVKEIVAVASHGYTVSELVALARKGDLESLLRLIRLDKVFLISRLAREWILQAQSREITEFFAALAASIRRDSFREAIASGEARLGVACYLLWFLGFDRLGKRRLLEFIESEGLAQYPDPKAFDKLLSRLGIKTHTD